MKRLVSFSLAVALAGCQFHTSQRIADWGRVHKGVAIDPGSMVVDEKNHHYVKGRVGTYKRRGLKTWTWVMTQPPQGKLIRVDDVFEPEECTVSFNLWSRLAWLKEAPTHSKLPARDIFSFLEKDEVYLMGEEESTLHAWWAYPLAGISFVAVDVPCTVLSIGGFALMMPVAGIVYGIRNGVVDIARQLTPEQQSPPVDALQK